MRKESMPCIICGKRLYRVDDDYEAQPSDAVMCSTSGNYGSTVYDPMMTGEVLLFNICDPCLVAAGNHTEARILTHRRYIPVQTDVKMGHMWAKSIVGSKEVRDDPLVPWNAKMEPRDDTEYLPIEYLAEHLDELLANDRYRWNLPRENLEHLIDEARKEGMI